MIMMSRLISSRQMVDVALGVLNLAAGGTFAPEFRDGNFGLTRMRQQLCRRRTMVLKAQAPSLYVSLDCIVQFNLL